MGMFDSILVDCPHCKEENEVQTKTGPCILQYHSLKDVPADVLEGALKKDKHVCEGCGESFKFCATACSVCKGLGVKKVWVEKA